MDRGKKDKDQEKEQEHFKKFRDQVFQSHKHDVEDIDWICKGSMLASADSSIKIWKCKNNSTLQKDTDYSKAHQSTVESLSWHPRDPNILASSSNDDKLKIWDVRQKPPCQVFEHKDGNKVVRWNNEGTTFTYSNRPRSSARFPPEINTPSRALTPPPPPPRQQGRTAHLLRLQDPQGPAQGQGRLRGQGLLLRQERPSDHRRRPDVPYPLPAFYLRAPITSPRR